MLKFYDEEPLLKASNLTHKIKDCPKTLICVWENKLVNAAIKKYAAKTIGTYKTGPVVPVYKLDCEGFEVGLILIPVGSPVAAATMEEAWVWGFEHFVFLGSCGVLDKSIKDGLIVPTKALRDEGTSWHYVSEAGLFVDVKTCKETSACLKKLNVVYTEGPVWTTDAVYRETPGAVKEAKDNGCIAVDMECSAINAVADYINADVRQFFFTADKLTDKTWDNGMLHKFDNDAFLIYFEIALALAKDMQK